MKKLEKRISEWKNENFHFYYQNNVLSRRSGAVRALAHAQSAIFFLHNSPEIRES